MRYRESIFARHKLPLSPALPDEAEKTIESRVHSLGSTPNPPMSWLRSIAASLFARSNSKPPVGTAGPGSSGATHQSNCPALRCLRIASAAKQQVLSIRRPNRTAGRKEIGLNLTRLAAVRRNHENPPASVVALIAHPVRDPAPIGRKSGTPAQVGPPLLDAAER